MKNNKETTEKSVLDALNYIYDLRHEAMSYDISVGIFPPTKEELDIFDTIETALRQMKQYKGEFVYCHYCNKTFDIDNNEGIKQHILNCRKHPIQEYILKVEDLESENHFLREKLL